MRTPAARTASMADRREGGVPVVGTAPAVEALAVPDGLPRPEAVRHSAGRLLVEVAVEEHGAAAGLAGGIPWAGTSTSTTGVRPGSSAPRLSPRRSAGPQPAGHRSTARAMCRRRPAGSKPPTRWDADEVHSVGTMSDVRPRRSASGGGGGDRAHARSSAWRQYLAPDANLTAVLAPRRKLDGLPALWSRTTLRGWRSRRRPPHRDPSGGAPSRDPGAAAAAASTRPSSRRGDRQSNELILELLHQTHPDDAVLSRSGRHPAGSTPPAPGSSIRSTDPGFGEDRDDWAVHVALVEKGFPRAAWRCRPGHDPVDRLAAGGCRAVDRRRAGRHRTRRRPRRSRPGRPRGGLLPMGSAGARPCVVLGEADLRPRRRQWEWDSAARRRRRRRRLTCRASTARPSSTTWCRPGCPTS